MHSVLEKLGIILGGVVDYEYLRDLCVGALEGLGSDGVEALIQEGVKTVSDFMVFSVCVLYGSSGGVCTSDTVRELKDVLTKVFRVRNNYVDECVEYAISYGLKDDVRT